MEILKTILTFIGAVSVPAVTLVIFWLKNKKDAVEKENDLLKDNIYLTKINQLKEIFDLKSFSKLEEEISQIFKLTFCDRFSIMVLMNGKVDFKFMTLLFDQRKAFENESFVMPYRKTMIDRRYHDLIFNLSLGQSEWLHKDFTRAGNIGAMFSDEDIKSIGFYKVKRVQLDDFNDLFVYCCWSTKSDLEPTLKGLLGIDMYTNSSIIPLIIDIIKPPSVYDSEQLLSEINTR
jgi:hypothetical protein